MWLEGQEHVENLLAVARLLHVGDLAASAIGDAGLRDLRGVDGVVALDIFGAHDAGHDQFADFIVDADLLLALDHEIAVRQHLGDDGGDAMFSYGGSYQLDQDRFTATLTTRRYADGPFTTVFGCDEVEAELTGTFNGNRAVCMGTAKQAPGVLFEATLFLQLPDAAPPPRPTCPPASGDLARLPRLTVDRRAPNPLASKRFV